MIAERLGAVLLAAWIVGGLLATGGCGQAAGPIAPPPAAAPAEDGQWTMPAKNYASTRFSGLDEITTQNVGKLQVAFSFSTGVNRGQEAAPLVVGSTMYVLTPFPNLLYALDLSRPGAPVKWRYDPG